PCRSSRTSGCRRRRTSAPCRCSSSRSRAPDVSSGNPFDVEPLIESAGPPEGSRRSRLFGDTLRQEGAKGVAIALVSTVAVVFALVWVIGHSANWPAVKQAFFNGQEFKDTFPEIAKKFVRNIEYFLIAEVFILAL